MRILVIGAGSIGCRHIKNLNRLGYKDIDVADPDANEERLKSLEIKNVYADFKDAVESKKYDAAFVCTPPVYHVPIASYLAKKGIDLFIEKPLSNSLRGVDALIRLKNKNKLVVMVGYNQRFNYGIRRIKSLIDSGALGRKLYYIRAEVGSYLPNWRPGRDYRKNYTARRELGGGIILDASHEIDYTLWLSGSRVVDVKAIYDKVSNLKTNVEDLAEIIMRFENGIIASVHLDMVSRSYSRECKAVGEKGHAKWIFAEDALETYTGRGKPLVRKHELDPNQSYVDELKHFINCIKRRSNPESNFETARETLKVVMKIKSKRG